MIELYKKYQRNGLPGIKASNKGDPEVIYGSRGDPPLWINEAGNFTQLPQNDTIQSNFLVSSKREIGCQEYELP